MIDRAIMKIMSQAPKMWEAIVIMNLVKMRSFRMMRNKNLKKNRGYQND